MSFGKPFQISNEPRVWAHNCGVMYGNVLLTSVGFACQHCGLIQSDCKPKESNVPQVKITDEMVEEALGKAKEHQAETPTLRDQFAMAALTGAMTNADVIGVTTGYNPANVAALAYRTADAMMEARK